MESPSSNLSKAEASSATPLVSVVIPAYNASEYIAEALDSVMAQTFKNYEVIVVNDGSPDTEQLERALEPYKDRIIYIKQKNRGPSGARNTAIRAARGEYIAMLDSDDAWLPAYLAEQVRILSDNPDLDMIYADAWLSGDADLPHRTFMEGAPSRGPVSFESLLRYDSSIITSGAVAKRQTLIDAGLFDEAFIRCEDFDLWIRVAHRGGKISYQKQILAKHRAHAASLAADTVKMVESQIEVLKKAQRTLPLTDEQRKLIETQLAHCAAQIDLHLGKQYFHEGEFQLASEALRRANVFYQSIKLRVVLWFLRASPGLLRFADRARRNISRARMARSR
jgi:glycosyltransferase involved in cell wall biosynthesis